MNGFNHQLLIACQLQIQLSCEWLLHGYYVTGHLKHFLSCQKRCWHGQFPIKLILQPEHAFKSFGWLRGPGTDALFGQLA